MTDEKPDETPQEQPPEMPESLKRLLGEITSAIKGMANPHSNMVEEQAKAAEDFARARAEAGFDNGISIPLPANKAEVPEKLHHLFDQLMVEQSKASLFLATIGNEHGYKSLLGALGKGWSFAAMHGAELIARHEREHGCGDSDHNHSDDELIVGPREYGAAWASICMTAVLGGIRFGQANPDALKGLEGVNEGDIDQAVVDLVAWVENQPKDEQEEEPPNKEE